MCPIAVKKLHYFYGIGAFLIQQTCINSTFANNKNYFMGRGDKKTAKGKRFKGSFGKSRPRKVAVKKKAAKKK
jgi:30S ribosomal protein S31